MLTSSRLGSFKYHILIASYLLVTGLAIVRVRRQPYSRTIKAGQIETILKGTTLGAAVVGIGLGGKINIPRSFED